MTIKVLTMRRCILWFVFIVNAMCHAQDVNSLPLDDPNKAVVQSVLSAVKEYAWPQTGKGKAVVKKLRWNSEQLEEKGTFLIKDNMSRFDTFDPSGSRQSSYVYGQNFQPNAEVADLNFTLEGLGLEPGTLVNDHVTGKSYPYQGNPKER